MRICLIGTFGHGGRAVSEMKNCSEAQFIGIAPGSTHEKKEALQRYALPVYEDYKVMLDTLKPDVAIVGPVFGLTGKIIMDCAARGIDVFSDKPVAGTLEELEEVEVALEEKHLIHQVKQEWPEQMGREVHLVQHILCQ